MIIYYGDNYCVLDKEPCQRGRRDECPKKMKAGIELPCCYFKIKEKK